MKTAEQLTADVLARRDAYLAERDKKRKAAKKYAAAGLCVCTAALAAAGLYRSGILNGDPPLSPDDITEASRPAAVSETTVSAGEPTSAPGEDGTGAREPTAKAAAQTATEPSSVDGRPARENTTAPTEEPGTVPARQTEPTTGQPDDPLREHPWASAEQTEEQDAPAETNGSPAAAEPTASPVEIGPSGSEQPGATPTTKKEEEQTAAPTTEPFVPEEDTTHNVSPQRNVSATYIIYNGGLYAVGDGMTVPIPEEAEVVGRQTVIVLRDDESIPTEALILSCPSEPQEVRTAVAAENENEMCLMEYLGTVEELLREETT